MRVHVLTRKEELDGERLPGKVVVVLDVLFATSSIATALAGGAAAVVPALDEAEARAEAASRPPGTVVLSGERNAETLPGFAEPTPLALAAQPLAGRTLVYATTNGTVALRKAAAAERVYAAALLNGPAVMARVARSHPAATVLLCCAGSAEAFNLEDFYGAGYLVSLLASGPGPAPELSDAAQAALLLHAGGDPLDCLSRSRVGRMMLGRGLEAEVAHAARKGALDVVPVLQGGAIRPG